MFKIKTVQAAFGDCFLIQFGADGNGKHILIDGGPPNNFANHLQTALQNVKLHGNDLELVVLSHVDNDHVKGLNDYFSALRVGDATLPLVRGLWHNSFSKTIAPGPDFQARFQSVMSHVQAAGMAHAGIAINGIKEGNKLRLDALALSIPINQGFQDDLIIVDTSPNPHIIDNLTITIVGPTQANLQALRQKWEKWLDANEQAIGSGDFAALANSDKSVPNLSSISFLLEADGKSALFTGDARSDHVLEGLGQAGRLDAQGNLHVDVLKLPHHGSNRNMTKSFLRKITADTYLVSADGTYDNPDYDTLAWIVEVASEKAFVPTLVLTNSTPSFEQLIQDFPPGDSSYLYKVLPQGQDWMTLVVA